MASVSDKTVLDSPRSAASEMPESRTARGEESPGLAPAVPEGTDKPAGISPEIFDAALTTFLSGRRLDMRALASEVGISRATLYRRAGSRDQLLGEVLWYLARIAMARASAAAWELCGRERVIAVIDHFLHDLQRAPTLRQLIESEPETALRILTSKHGRVQGGIVDALAYLIKAEREAGYMDPGLDQKTLAYAIVRIGESFLYADVIADTEPDVDRAVEVIERLLR